MRRRKRQTDRQTERQADREECVFVREVVCVRFQSHKPEIGVFNSIGRQWCMFHRRDNAHDQIILLINQKRIKSLFLGGQGERIIRPQRTYYRLAAPRHDLPVYFLLKQRSAE